MLTEHFSVSGAEVGTGDTVVNKSRRGDPHSVGN